MNFTDAQAIRVSNAAHRVARLKHRLVYAVRYGTDITNLKKEIAIAEEELATTVNALVTSHGIKV